MGVHLIENVVDGENVGAGNAVNECCVAEMKVLSYCLGVDSVVVNNACDVDANC